MKKEIIYNTWDIFTNIIKGVFTLTQTMLSLTEGQNMRNFVLFFLKFTNLDKNYTFRQNLKKN